MLQCFSPSLSLSLPPPAQCLHWRNQLKGPLGPQFKHCNLQHMAHFQLPRSIKAIYWENVAKFPKVSTQFIAECLVYHIKNQLSGLHSPCRDFHQRYQRLLRVVWDILSSLIANISFRSPLFLSTAHNTNLITCKLEISPDPSKWYFFYIHSLSSWFLSPCFSSTTHKDWEN